MYTIFPFLLSVLIAGSALYAMDPEKRIPIKQRRMIAAKMALKKAKGNFPKRAILVRGTRRPALLDRPPM